MKSIREWQVAAYENSKAHGFHDAGNDIPRSLALIHSEVSEALEAYRNGEMETVANEKGKPEGFGSELADVVIRCLDLAGALGIDLETEIERKHAFNVTRPHKHGGKRC